MMKKLKNPHWMYLFFFHISVSLNALFSLVGTNYFLLK